MVRPHRGGADEAVNHGNLPLVTPPPEKDHHLGGVDGWNKSV
jgi:hypothetical protein